MGKRSQRTTQWPRRVRRQAVPRTPPPAGPAPEGVHPHLFSAGLLGVLALAFLPLGRRRSPRFS